MVTLKKLILLIGILVLLLVGCGKTKIKTYTLAEKEAYLEKANNGDNEARQFIKEKINETEKIYKESKGDQTAYLEWKQWRDVGSSLKIDLPTKELAW